MTWRHFRLRQLHPNQRPLPLHDNQSESHTALMMTYLAGFPTFKVEALRLIDSMISVVAYGVGRITLSTAEAPIKELHFADKFHRVVFAQYLFFRPSQERYLNLDEPQI
jgi:hypothetical protein